VNDGKVDPRAQHSYKNLLLQKPPASNIYNATLLGVFSADKQFQFTPLPFVLIPLLQLETNQHAFRGMCSHVLHTRMTNTCLYHAKPIKWILGLWSREGTLNTKRSWCSTSDCPSMPFKLITAVIVCVPAKATLSMSSMLQDVVLAGCSKQWKTHHDSSGSNVLLILLENSSFVTTSSFLLDKHMTAAKWLFLLCVAPPGNAFHL